MRYDFKLKADDLFFRPCYPTRIYRIHRIHGTQVYYLGNEYGAYPAQGIIQKAHKRDCQSWVKVERNYNAQ